MTGVSVYRRLCLQTAVAAIHEIIRQKKKDLTITRSNAADDFDMLIGAGCVKRFIATFISLGVYGLARCYRRSIEKGSPQNRAGGIYQSFPSAHADGGRDGHALRAGQGHGGDRSDEH
jgi:hypothetical protein